MYMWYLTCGTRVRYPAILPSHTSNNRFLGASLSEPHTSVTALRKYVCIYACTNVCLFGPTTYRKFQMSAFKYFTGWCKTWTLDSGLEYGLDYGLIFGLSLDSTTHAHCGSKLCLTKWRRLSMISSIRM